MESILDYPTPLVSTPPLTRCTPCHPWWAWQRIEPHTPAELSLHCHSLPPSLGRWSSLGCPCLACQNCHHPTTTGFHSPWPPGSGRHGCHMPHTLHGTSPALEPVEWLWSQLHANTTAGVTQSITTCTHNRTTVMLTIGMLLWTSITQRATQHLSLLSVLLLLLLLLSFLFQKWVNYRLHSSNYQWANSNTSNTKWPASLGNSLLELANGAHYTKLDKQLWHNTCWTACTINIKEPTEVIT